MKVLLTGASGFVGRHVLKALQDHKIEVIAVGLTRPQLSVEHVNVDFLQTVDFGPLVQQVKATHLLHLAWYAEHGKYWASPLNLRWTYATTRLVDAFCGAGGRRVVIAGTCAEYDWAHGYCRENVTPLKPSTLYGTAKDATRRLAMAVCAQYQVSCAWGRIFFPYGLGESANRLIPSLIDVYRGVRAPFSVNSSAYRDFLHVVDVAEGFVQLLKSEANGAYNICSGEPVRLGEVVTTLASLMGLDPEPILALSAKRPGEPHLLAGENQKLKSLGWQTTHTLRQGLERILCEVGQ